MSDAPDTAAAPAAGDLGGDAKGLGKGGAAAKPNKIILIALIAGPLLLGGGAGALLIGPQLVGGKTAGAAEKKPKNKKKDAKEGEGAKTAVFKIDNLIVNPAGSQGSHFLMTQIVIQCEDKKQAALLKSNEFKVKDLIISAIEQRTLEQLTEPGARDSIKLHILQAVLPLAYPRQMAGLDAEADAGDSGDHAQFQVFLPQFVIQ